MKTIKMIKNINDIIHNYIVHIIHYYGYTEQDISYCYVGKFKNNEYLKIKITYDAIKDNCKKLFYCNDEDDVFIDLKIKFNDEKYIFLIMSRFIFNLKYMMNKK